jgi:predicted enzyme related to lactoylglutathione lyase
MTNAQLSTVVIDCADPRKLAAFYQDVTGWEIGYADDDFVYLGSGPVQLAFQRIANYQGPKWPDDAKHAHLDLRTADIERTANDLLKKGATRPDFQPGEGKWIVMADPEGHVFCLTPAE